MKLEPIIQQLQATIPLVTDLFSEKLTIVSISKSGLVATVETSSAHGLSAGDFVTMGEVYSPVEIDTFSADAETINVKTVTAHDFTKSDTAIKDQNQQVRITGATFDEEYLLQRVPNRFRLYLDATTGPSFPGAETLYVQEQAVNGYNGLKQVDSVPTSTTFTYTMDFDYPEPNEYDGAFVSVAQRISGAINEEIAANSYTKQSARDKYWLFVLPEQNISNKDRRNPTDSQSNQSVQGDFRQYIIDSFKVHMYIPNKGDEVTDSNGRFAWDSAQDLRPSLLKAVLGIQIETGFACQGQEVIQYNGDQAANYNGAVYIHEFNFQMSVQITKDDTFTDFPNRAFRDIETTHKNQFSETTTYTAEIDLDEEPENS